MTDTERAPRWLEYRLIDDLPEAVRNAKDHDDDLLDASLERFGFTEPPLLDERTGRLVAGHGRKAMAARAEADGGALPDGVIIGPDGRWLVPIVRGWASANDDEAEAYGVTSNRSAEAGGWRIPDLADVLVGLRDGPGLHGVGYSPVDVDMILASLTPPPEPEPPDGFPGVDPDGMEFAHTCPRCQFQFDDPS